MAYIPKWMILPKVDGSYLVTFFLGGLYVVLYYLESWGWHFHVFTHVYEKAKINPKLFWS